MLNLSAMLEGNVLQFILMSQYGASCLIFIHLDTGLNTYINALLICRDE